MLDTDVCCVRNTKRLNIIFTILLKLIRVFQKKVGDSTYENFSERENILINGDNLKRNCRNDHIC